MRGRMVGALVLVSLALATGLPARDVLVQELAGDTAVVESTIREVRAAVPAASNEEKKEGDKKLFIRTFGASEDEKNKIHGYRQRVNDDGDDGYKHFDSFHKKKGDKYGYETFSSYGAREHGEKAGSNHDESKNEESSEYGAEEGDDGDEAKETKHTYKVVEDGEEGDEGESGGQYSSYGSEGEGDGENYSESSSGSGSYSTGGESGTSYSSGGEYSSDDGGDGGEYSEGYSEGGSSGSSYSSSEGEDDGDY